MVLKVCVSTILILAFFDLRLNFFTDLYLLLIFEYHTFVIKGGLLTGWFETEAKAAFLGTNIPLKNWKDVIANDPSHWRPLWDKVVHRMPILSQVVEPFIYICPDTFTPDGRWILGESSAVKNYFVGVGMNGNTLEGILMFLILL